MHSMCKLARFVSSLLQHYELLLLLQHVSLNVQFCQFFAAVFDSCCLYLAEHLLA